MARMDRTSAGWWGRTAGLAFTLAFTGAVAPGPLLALVIAQSLAQGLGATAFILLGHALLEVVLVVLLARGLGRRLAGPGLRGGLAMAGGAVLVWMGAGLLGEAPGLSLSAAAAERALPWHALLLAGAGVSLTNPYFTGWWATVGSGQMAALRLERPLDYGVFLAAHEAGDAVWYLFVSVVLVAGRAWLTDHVYQVLLTLCAAVIVALGVGFVLSAARLVARGLAGPPAAAADGNVPVP